MTTKPTPGLWRGRARRDAQLFLTFAVDLPLANLLPKGAPFCQKNGRARSVSLRAVLGGWKARSCIRSAGGEA